MRVLVVGAGGREHALAWACARSSDVEEVIVAPGNAGTALEPKVRNVDIAATDLEGLVALARRARVDLTIVGPETPLVAGLVDRFEAAGLACFGPSAAASRLEGSKSFSKAFMARHQVPTASYGVFSNLDQAIAHIRTQDRPLVVKADGLAAGKGVVVADSAEEAEQAARDMLEKGRFGEAGRRLVIEERLSGEEASFICLVDGEQILPLATSQDHKPRDDGDRGPNTGGMGAYSPAPVVNDVVHDRIVREVITPTVRGLSAEGTPYRGFLYAGVMITADGTPKVLEFNCRLGDPEAQPLLMRLRSDLPRLCLAALQGRLSESSIAWDARTALGIVMAAGGYPEEYRTGDPISGLERVEAEHIKVFHAGTTRSGDRIVTNGGRVLCVCALGRDLAEAQREAYRAASEIHWPGVHYRKDIGRRALLKR
jgi:phosphoribosylamine--glycine ligase